MAGFRMDVRLMHRRFTPRGPPRPCMNEMTLKNRVVTEKFGDFATFHTLWFEIFQAQLTFSILRSQNRIPLRFYRGPPRPHDVNDTNQR